MLQRRKKVKKVNKEKKEKKERKEKKESKENSMREIDVSKILSGRKGYTVVQLKEFLREMGLTVSGKKDELIDRLKNALMSNEE